MWFQPRLTWSPSVPRELRLSHIGCAPFLLSIHHRVRASSSIPIVMGCTARKNSSPGTAICRPPGRPAAPAPRTGQSALTVQPVIIHQTPLCRLHATTANHPLSCLPLHRRNHLEGVFQALHEIVRRERRKPHHMFDLRVVLGNSRSLPPKNELPCLFAASDAATCASPIRFKQDMPHVCHSSTQLIASAYYLAGFSLPIHGIAPLSKNIFHAKGSSTQRSPAMPNGPCSG